MLLANPLGEVADSIFALPCDDLTMPLAWIGVLAYSLQIFFDFSGYSDMAIGLGRMFGFRFLENFNYPYIAKFIREFWRIKKA
jgi:alginate O-acetyltransferase complex protein AlgI